MPTFLFKGYNEDGQMIAGSKNLSDRKAMEAYLEKKKIMGYEIFDSQTSCNNKLFTSVTPKELSIFCRQVSVLFFSDITLMEGVQLLEEQAENKELKIVLKEMYEFMSQGYTFAEAMAMYPHVFNAYMLKMIAMGEMSGTLDIVFTNLSTYYEKENRTKKKMKAAFSYPIILTAMMAAIVVLLIVKILPMFNDILRSMGGKMPPLTAWVLKFSAVLNQFGLYVLVGIAAIVIGFVVYIRTESGILWFDKLKLRLPFTKYIYQRVIVARFSRSLSILLKSGVQIVNALEEIKHLIDNRYFENKLEIAIDQVAKGEDLSTSLKNIDFFPPLFLKMIVIGQTTGKLDEMSEKSAAIFDEEVEDALEKLTILIEPILIIILSIVVGIILISVMLPMISIMTNIG